MFNEKEFKELQERECEAFYKWADMPDSELKTVAKAAWIKIHSELEAYAKKHNLM